MTSQKSGCVWNPEISYRPKWAQAPRPILFNYFNMADKNETKVRARLYTKLYYIPTKVLDKKSIQELKDMLKDSNCELCGKSFRGQFGKRIHMREVHSKPTQTNGDSDSNSD